MKNYLFLVFFICGFIFIQIVSGTAIFLSKIGYQPSMWYEYYYGSEEASQYFSNIKSFKEPLTIQGRIKVLYSHFFGYGIFIFFITHLLRSLNHNKINTKWIDRFCLMFFLIAFLEISTDITLILLQHLNFYVKIFFLYFRFLLFLVFLTFTFVSVLLFFYFIFYNKI